MASAELQYLEGTVYYPLMSSLVIGKRGGGDAAWDRANCNETIETLSIGGSAVRSVMASSTEL